MRLYTHTHTHTHTHTSSFIRRKKGKIWNNDHSGIYQGTKPSVSNECATAGITLVALVVTIVVLLILAGITISYVMGDNSVFKKASDAKLKADIAQWQERLELAKSPVFIEGLGTFNPDKYFDYIQQQGIINNKDTDVIDNEDGTYDITTKPEYVFLVTLMPSKENPKDAEIEYLGQTGNLQPKIKGISIVEATRTSFKIKVSARLEGGEVLCYYKAKADVAENETENDITGYTPMTLDSNLEGSVTSGLTAGTTYKVKAVLKKEGADIGWVSKEVTTSIIVTSITLNKTTTKIDVGKSETLTVTVEPENAENKEVEWTSDSTSIATVDQNGKVTGVAVGTATITVTAKDRSDKSATCSVTVEQAESDWAKIAEVAKMIAEDSTITKNTETITKGGMTINVGDSFYVKYDGALKEVIVLGFNHDDLTSPTVAYGSETIATKAGISFQFKNFMTDSTHVMNAANNNSNGWGATVMRSYLATEISKDVSSGGFSDIFKNSVKQVKKQYIKTYNEASSNNNYSDDKLWLLSCSEIFSGSSGDKPGGFGYAIAFEGYRYKYYIKLKATDTTGHSGLIKKKDNGAVCNWWLRSPSCGNNTAFCDVDSLGGSNSNRADANYGASPGFSI